MYFFAPYPPTSSTPLQQLNPSQNSKGIDYSTTGVTSFLENIYCLDPKKQSSLKKKQQPSTLTYQQKNLTAGK